jgi:hypothetical protein
VATGSVPPPPRSSSSCGRPSVSSNASTCPRTGRSARTSRRARPAAVPELRAPRRHREPGDRDPTVLPQPHARPRGDGHARPGEGPCRRRTGGGGTVPGGGTPDQPEPEAVRVELGVALRVARDGRHAVDGRYRCRHTSRTCAGLSGAR